MATITTPTPLGPQITSTTKPGYKTSEFWKSAVVVILGLLVASGVLGDNTTADHVAGLIAAALSSGTYAVSRGLTKSAA